MRKKERLIVLTILLVCCLSGCLGTVWTGASVVYDRHSMYQKLNDYHLLAEVNDVLAVNKTFNNSSCVIDIAVFHGDVLLAGHLPSPDMLAELRHRLSEIKGYRRLFIELSIRHVSSNSVQDSWITAKIRSQIFADSSIDPNAFKIVTSDRIVYLMGDVKAVQADKVIKIASSTYGVERVVKLLRYFTWTSDKKT
jgi:osmotically-inducible protein OsmY